MSCSFGDPHDSWMVSSFRLSIAPKKIDERESEHNGTKDPTGDKHLLFAILLFRVWTISFPLSNSFVRCSFVPICSFGLCQNQWVFVCLQCFFLPPSLDQCMQHEVPSQFSIWQTTTIFPGWLGVFVLLSG